MALRAQNIPDVEIIVTHSSVDYTYLGSIQVRMKENGFDTATALIAEAHNLHYDNISCGDAVEIKQGEKGTTLTTLLKGVIRRIDPILNKQGNYLKLECDGSGYGLNAMKCGGEYGSDISASLDTIKEIIEDNTDGIIDVWTNKLLGTATASGFSYTTQIETIAGTIPYVYFAYKPCDKSINDLCDIVQAIKGTNAGVHWRVDTSDRFLLATVGNHGAPASTYWTTYWNTDADGSTLTEGFDFENFVFQKPDKLANYVLYHGRLKKPAKELWTENYSTNWEIHEIVGGGGSALADDNSAGNFVVNSYSLKATSETGIGSGEGIWFNYPDPDSTNLNLNITRAGGQYNVPAINFYCKVDGNIGLSAGSTPSLNLHTGGVAPGAGDRFTTTFGGLLVASTWTYVSIPVGPYAKTLPVQNVAGDGLWTKWGNADWSDIDWIEFGCLNSASNGIMWVDGLHFSGWVLRGARQSGAYSSSDPCKMQIITDDVGKDDSLLASDDSGLMARLAYAEYLRSSSTPIVGVLQTRILNDIYPGQLIHLHAKKKPDGSYAIDKNFRVLKIVHDVNINGATTSLEVTDDVKNSNPIPVPNRVNRIFEAVKPEFQNRQNTSLKTREIDVTQAILEKSY